MTAGNKALSAITEAETLLQSIHQSRFFQHQFPPAFTKALGEIAVAKAALEAQTLHQELAEAGAKMCIACGAELVVTEIGDWCSECGEWKK